jgi:hypothetical protein
MEPQLKKHYEKEIATKMEPQLKKHYEKEIATKRELRRKKPKILEYFHLLLLFGFHFLLLIRR